MTKHDDLVEAARALIAEAARTGTTVPQPNDPLSVGVHQRFNDLAGDQDNVDGSEPDPVEGSDEVVDEPKRSHRRKG